jgi:cytochrome c oxidase assembly factor CtaG
MVVDWPLVSIVVAAGCYLAGRRPSDTWRRDACFYAGLLTLVVALDSPVDRYADRLFAVHMAQHVLLTMVAPPLLLLGRPWPRSLRALPLGARRRVARALLACRAVAAPLPAFALFNGVLLGWHVPALYDLTLRSEPVHVLEHTLFVVTGLLFWAQLVPSSRRPRLSAAQRAAYGVGAIGTGWALALVLAVASHPLYAPYAALGHRPGGLSALADQQLAAGIMWVPASIPLTVAVFLAGYRFFDPPARSPAAHDLRPRET